MRSVAIWAATLTLVCARGGAAVAQPTGAPEPLRDRTGPAAGLPPTPDYARPTVLPSAAPQAPPLTSAQGTVAFADIVVATDGSGAARFSADWRPSPDPLTGSSLEVRPGEAVDAAWVRRQFVRQSLIGRPVALDRIVALVQQINLALGQNGYVNSGVRIAGGVAREGGVLNLTLVLGRLTSDAGGEVVTVRWGPGGPRGLDAAFVQDRMGAAYDTPLNARTLEQQFRLLAENPAVATVNADLRPGAQPGSAALIVTVIPQARFDFYLTAANDRSPSIGAERYAIGGSARNLIFSGDLASAEAGDTSGHGDVLASYETPFLDPATTLSIHGDYDSAAVVDRPLVPLDITAHDWLVEGGLTRRLVDTPLTPAPDGRSWTAARTVSIGLRIAHRRSETTLLGQPFSFSPGSVNGVAEYTALRLTGDWVERGARSVTAVSMTLTKGLDGTGGDIPGLATPDRHFTVLMGQLSHAQRLTSGGLELRVRLSGQAATGILYSGERISAGGQDTVRGYRETLLLADTGVIGSVELAHPLSLDGGRRDERGLDWGGFQLSGFVDGAALRNREGAQPVPSSIGSVGASLAWTPGPSIYARLTYAKALKFAPVPGDRDLQDRGVEFHVTLRPLALLGGLKGR